MIYGLPAHLSYYLMCTELRLHYSFELPSLDSSYEALLSDMIVMHSGRLLIAETNNSTSNVSLFQNEEESKVISDFIVTLEFQKFAGHLKTAKSATDVVDLILLILGVFGNILALITMFKSRASMSTPSFVYHKALVSANLLYCCNYLLMKFVDNSWSFKSGSKYTTYLLAYYASILNRVITSSCGYVTMYMALAVSFDRFVAIWCFKSYPVFNRPSVARSLLVLSLILAVGFHSWSPWFERTIIVVKGKITDSGDLPATGNVSTGPTQPEKITLLTNNVMATVSQLSDQSNNGEVTLFASRSYSTPLLSRLINVKDYYNMVLRVLYPLLLTILTTMVISGFVSRRKRLHHNLSHGSVWNLKLQRPPSRNSAVSWSAVNDGPKFSKQSKFSVDVSMGGGVSSSTTATNVVRNLAAADRRDAYLYYLMVSVVILVCLHVLPREAKRVLDLLYPNEQLLSCMANKNGQLALKERLKCFYIWAYGHQMFIYALNTLTTVDRSMVFYLYFALNHSFRRSVKRVFLCRKDMPRRKKTSGYATLPQMDVLKPQQEERSITSRQQSLKPPSEDDIAARNRNSEIRASRRNAGDVWRRADSSPSTFASFLVNRGAEQLDGLVLNVINEGVAAKSPAATACVL